MSGTPIEIERKFLIRMPDIPALIKNCQPRIKQIEQTYLLTDDGSNARVRRICEGESIFFVKTVKKRISTLSCYEDEFEITEAQYADELKNADPNRLSINKTRYSFPFGSHVAEIDIYSFWDDRATLEVELSDENEEFILPEFINVIKEVSADSRYKNTNLAISVPMDII